MADLKLNNEPDDADQLLERAIRSVQSETVPSDARDRTLESAAGWKLGSLSSPLLSRRQVVSICAAAAVVLFVSAGAYVLLNGIGKTLPTLASKSAGGKDVLVPQKEAQGRPLEDKETPQAQEAWFDGQKEAQATPKTDDPPIPREQSPPPIQGAERNKKTAPAREVVARPPLVPLPAELRLKLEALGAKVNAQTYGYSIYLSNKPQFTDSEVAVVVQCPQLVDLTMEKVPITDQGLEQLQTLSHLRRLILNHCPISATGLKTLADSNLRNTLTCIGLRSTQLNDDDVTLIQQFSRLERLDISQTAFTDRSLPALQTLPLKYLDVAGTQISEGALSQLRERNPKLVLKR